MTTADTKRPAASSMMSTAPTCSDNDLARAIEIAQRLTAGGLIGDGTLLSRALLVTVARYDALQTPAIPCDRETGGQFVRKVWIAWAMEQPNPKPSWLVPWEELSEPDKEVDRRIFEACYASGRSDGETGLLSEVNRLLTLEYASASDIAEHVIRLEAADEARIAGEETIARLTRELAKAQAEAEENRRTIAKIAQAGTLDTADARRVGELEERARWAPLGKAFADLIYWAKRFEMEPQGVGLDAVERALAKSRERAESVASDLGIAATDGGIPDPMTAVEVERWRRHGARYALGYTAGEETEREACAQVVSKRGFRWLGDILRARGTK